MPSARARDGTRLRYDLAGGGLNAPAVLLVMGLAFEGEAWGETRDVLAAAGYRTITMDNRGAGESASASSTFSTSVMADDAVAVLRAAFVERAHVVGVSLGRHDRAGDRDPARRTGRRPRAAVHERRPAARGPRGSRAPLPLRRPLARAPRESRVRARGASRAPRADDAALRRAGGYLGQVGAAWRHRAWKRLSRIGAPPLIQHGTRDGLIRPAAARAMAARIPSCELQLYPRAGHVLAVQRPESLAAVRKFLRAHDDLLAP